MTQSEPGAISADLESEERYLLRRGLDEWGGPARPTGELARVIGFADVADLLTDGRRLGQLIEQGSPLSRADWLRALLATEIAFASIVVGYPQLAVVAC